MRPAAGRQGADRAGEAQGEAGGRGGRPGAVGEDWRRDLRGVLGADAEEPEGGVRRGHRCGAAALGQEGEEGEEGPQHGGQDEDALQVVVEEVRVRAVGRVETTIVRQ